MAERPTPHSVAVCTLIALHSDPSSLIHKSTHKTSSSSKSTNDDDFSLVDIEEHLSKLIKFLVFHGDTMPLHNLLNLLSGKSGSFAHAAQFLLEDLNQSCVSIDSLVDLYAALRATIAQGIVDGDSAHGIYVRKHCLGFDELAFESVGRFWESFCDYVYDASDWPNIHHGRSIHHGEGKHSSNDCDEDGILMTNDEDRNAFYMDGHILQQQGEEKQHSLDPNWPLAPHQISRMLFKQSLNLQQESGKVSYVDMEAKIQELLKENPELTLAHFLRFLNDIMHGERAGALDSFHRYFDYAMIQNTKFRLSQPSLPSNHNNNSNNNNNTNNNIGNRDGNDNNTSSTRVVQYSSVLLASLFHKFANDELSSIAANEAIRAAQQSGDEACLAYALGWLSASNSNDHNAFGMSDFSSNGMETLSRASNKAAQLNIRSLVAGASFMRANHILMGRDNDNEITLSGLTYSLSLIPSQAWHSISAASTEGSIANNLGGTSFPFDIPTHARNLDESSDVMNVFAQQNLSGAALWYCMGHTAMASTSFQATMRCYESRLTSEQYGIVAREIASSAIYGTGSTKSYFSQESSDPQSLCSSLEQLRLTSKGKHSGFDSATSVYQLAIQKLKETLFDTLSYHGIQWNHDVIKLLHDSTLQKCNINIASSLNTLLYSCAPLASRDHSRLSVDLLGHSSSLFCRQRKWNLAKQLILERILPLCETNKFHYHHAYYLLQLSLVHFESSSYDSIRALTPILACLSIAEKYSIDVIHASALSLLARLHFEQGNLSLARSILSAAMPTITQNAHISFQGEALLCMAKCNLGEAKSLFNKPTKISKVMANMERKKTILLKKALLQLEKAQIAFEKAVDVIHLREVYYLLAHAHASLPGHSSRRNLAAKRFREMNRLKVQSTRPNWYDAIENIKRSIGWTFS